MSSPVEQKAELQPVHRIFLGELFVFVFFFAGAMSVLVGPLAVPVATAGMTIGAAVVLSGLCFLWLAFTTPMRKVEPRYEFLVLSLLPGLLICMGVLGFTVVTKPKTVPNYNVAIFTHGKSNFSSPPPSAKQIFKEELSALDETLTSMGFSAAYADERWVRYHRPGKAKRNVEIYALLAPFNDGSCVMTIGITNYDMFHSECYFESPEESWVQVLAVEVSVTFQKIIEDRYKAAEKKWKEGD